MSGYDSRADSLTRIHAVRDRLLCGRIVGAWPGT